MKQNRTIKSLLPRDNRDGKWFTVLLLILSVILCLGSASLMTVSVGAAGDDEDWFIPYTGHDGNTEVLYKLEFSDLDNLGVKVIDEVYLDNNSVIVTPNVIKVENNTGDAEKYVNFLGGENNEVYSDDITIIAGLNNNVSSGNDSASVLGGEGNKVTGDSHGVPVIIAGGLANKIEDGKGNVVLGGEENEIVGSSSSIVLGGKKNVISGGENIMIGGENVKVSDVSDIFAFSDSDLDFQPEDSGAFYLNLSKGVGIYTDSAKKGVSLSGAVGFGNIDIETEQCDDDNIGVEGARNGCLVGCTEESKLNGKWELLDRGTRCEELCNNEKCIFKAFTGLEEAPDYTGFCFTDHIDVSNATRCTTGENEAYKNVVFGSVLIDYEAECPITGNNKCVYRCNPETHLTGDAVGGTNAVMCYKDCELPWGETIKHNETRIAYNIEDVTCSNDVYVFPLETEIINKPVSTYQIGNISKNGLVYQNRDKNGKSFESCGNYDHKKTLVCLSGSLYLLGSGGKADRTTKTVAEMYKYQSCNLHDYRCDTGVYSLTSQQIENEKNDRPANANGNRVVADRGILTGVRGLYKICVDYNADPAVNGESCATGVTSYHYQFTKCQSGYDLQSDGVCRKRCTLIGINGSSSGYLHGSIVTGYQATGAICTGTCLAEQIVCNDGTWRLGSLNGEENMQYLYHECDLKNKVCSTGDYNVEQSVVTNSGQHSIYESCDPYEASGMFECVKKDTVNKLVGCEEEYHTENNLYCEPNKKEVNCAYITGKHDGSGKYIDANVTVEWTGEWNNGNWTTPSECEWKCNEGYHLSGFVCVSNVMEVDCRENGKPDNSYYIEGKEFILWSASDGWPSRPNCDWECDDGYAEKNENCYLSVSTLLSGQDFNMTIKRLAGNSSALYTTSGTEIQHIVQWSGSVLPEGIVTGIVSTADSEFPVYAWFDDGIIYYYTEAEKIYMNSDSDSMFSNMEGLEDIDFAEWDTSNVTSMKYMFYNCSSLGSLDLSMWNVGSVKSMGSMFRNCGKLTELDLSSWNTSEVTSLDSTFMGCSNLVNLSVGTWKTDNVRTLYHTFRDCKKLVNLDVSKRNVGNVVEAYGTFQGCSSLTGLDVSEWNTSNIRNMFKMFNGCSNLQNLDVSKWDTSSLENTNSMFAGCRSLKGLDVSNWIMSGVDIMSSMFQNCENLIGLDVSNWNTSNVTSMSNMFYGCKNLKNLDVSNWNTENVTSMSETFYGCSSLTGLDVSEWETDQVTLMGAMFYGCKNLINLDVSRWNTSNVTHMYQMFYNCSSLTGLDLSSWNTSNVADIHEMFYNCNNLTEIYASQLFVTSGLKTNDRNHPDEYYHQGMFAGDIKLKGGSGTVYDSSFIDKTYARIDQPSLGLPGYFTLKQ